MSGLLGQILGGVLGADARRSHVAGNQRPALGADAGEEPARIAAASASLTTTIREACASLDPDQVARTVHAVAFFCRSGVR
jgi:Na+/alanine symporter